VFLWFWLTALVIITGRYVSSPATSYLSSGLSLLLQLLHILGMNMEPFVFGELVVELAEQMKDANNNSMEKDIGQTRTLLTQI
jgi:hypothetical protein